MKIRIKRRLAVWLACGVFVPILFGIRMMRDAEGSSREAMLMAATQAERLDSSVIPSTLSHLLDDRQAGGGRPLSDWLDRPVVLNFWATFCEPCLDEWPSLLALAASRPSVSFLLVSYDDGWPAIDAFLKVAAPEGLPANVVVVRDAAQEPDLKMRLGTQKMPDTYWIRDGMVRLRFVNARDWAASPMMELFRDVME